VCGRFAFFVPAAQIASQYDLGATPTVEARYNIAPTQNILAIRQGSDGQREPAMLRWGLVPHWAKDLSIGNRMINARGETVAAKPAFRQAFKRRRCIVPASGFYEWTQSRAGKWPHFISMQDGSAMSFAGLWEQWRGSDDEPVESCTIITTAATGRLADIHARMPVLLAASGFGDWLDPETPRETCLALLEPEGEASVEIRPVSRAVNSPRNDAAELVERVEIPAG
jgi:putative SOS response-associated peptidase YedK